MAIDTTLDKVLIPNLPTFTPEFGTKKTSGGLSTQECAEADMRPFTYQRPIKVTATDSTTEVERHCSFLVTASGITLTIKDATFEGCEARVLNTSTGNITIKGGTKGINGSTSGITLAAGTCINLVFLASGWRTLMGVASTGAALLPAIEAESSITDSTTLLAHNNSSKKVEKKTISNVWTYIQNKISSVLGLDETGYTGTAATATKLETARTIKIQDSTATNTGAEVSFDGSGNATLKLPATMAANITGNSATATKDTNGNNILDYVYKIERIKDGFNVYTGSAMENNSEKYTITTEPSVSFLAYTNTSSSSQNKLVMMQGNPSLSELLGKVITVRFNNGNTHSKPYIELPSGEKASIRWRGKEIRQFTWDERLYLDLCYDGSYWQIIGYPMVYQSRPESSQASAYNIFIDGCKILYNIV